MDFITEEESENRGAQEHFQEGADSGSGSSIIYFQDIKAEAARILNENGWEGKFSVGGDERVPEGFQARYQHLSCLISLDNGLDIKIEEPHVGMIQLGPHNFFGEISCNFLGAGGSFRRSQHDFRRVFERFIKEQLCSYETVPPPGQKRQGGSQVEETPPPPSHFHTIHDAMEADGHARVPDQKGLDRIKEIKDEMQRHNMYKKFIAVCNSLAETNAHLGRSLYESNYRLLVSLAELAIREDVDDAMEADGHARLPDQKGLDRIKEIMDPVERRAAALKLIDVCNSLAETNASLGRTDVYKYWGLAALADVVANPPRRSTLCRPL